MIIGSFILRYVVNLLGPILENHGIIWRSTLHVSNWCMGKIGSLLRFPNLLIHIIKVDKLKSQFLWFLLSIYDSNESIDFVHGKSKIFYRSSGRIRTFYR
jgi:hypothetical protein